MILQSELTLTPPAAKNSCLSLTIKQVQNQMFGMIVFYIRKDIMKKVEV